MAKRIRRLLARLCRWTLWLVLAAVLVFQFRLLSDGGFRLPAFAAESLAGRLAEQGLAVQADDVWIDPRGRVLLIRPRVALRGSPSGFGSAEAIEVWFLPRALLGGRFECTRIEIAGLALTLPAAHSPTGADQTLLEGGEFRLSRSPGSPRWRLEQSSGRVLAVPTAFTGALPTIAASVSPAGPAPVVEPGIQRPDELVRKALRRASALYLRLAELPLDSIDSLRIDLAEDRLAVAVEIPALFIPAYPSVPPVLVGSSLNEVRLVLTIPFAEPDDTELRLHAVRLATPPGLSLVAENLSVRLRAPARAELVADLAAASIRKTDTPLPAVPLVASVRYAPAARRLVAGFSTRLADAAWSASFDGDPVARAGAASAAGPLTPALLEFLRAFLPEKARPILELTDPVDLDFAATLAPGGVPARVEARAASGRAVAGRVPFDRAGASLLYEPFEHRLLADDLLLVQGDSGARGSYEMDTESLAFRFLLGGRLRPMAIEGWFSGWWDRLWANFSFGPVPPAAEVDIRGVWGDPPRTTVFVGADSGSLGLRALELDTLAIRVYVHRAATELLGFRATRGEHLATGAFARHVDMAADHDDWSRLSFDVRSDFPIEALPRLFPEEGAEIVAPFRLEAPPRIHLVGEAFGPGSDTPGAERYTLDLATSAPLRYHGFPLDRLSTRLERRDDEIHLEDLRAGFADGVVSGRATLSGPASARWLAFDMALADARLDLALLRWREFQAESGGASPSPGAAGSPSTSTRSPLSKPLGGSLTLALAATGPIDRPLAFGGRGSARITGADLAKIRLLGGLSSILSEIGIGLTTVELTDADALFNVEQNRLVFDSLRLTGPSALVQADGDYVLPAGALAFSARVRPFEQRSGILSSTAGFVLSPLSNALEIKLTGTLDEPDWSFSYGPTQLFRRITGASAKPASPPVPPTTP